MRGRELKAAAIINGVPLYAVAAEGTDKPGRPESPAQRTAAAERPAGFTDRRSDRAARADGDAPCHRPLSAAALLRSRSALFRA